jgi:hypothetical protein
MSQRPSAIRPAASPPPDGRVNPPPPSGLPQDDSQQAGRQGFGPGRGMHQEHERRDPRHEEASQPLMAEHSSQNPPIEESRRHSGSSRGLGVHNILNPTESDPPGGSTPHIDSRLARSPQSGGPLQFSATPSSFTSQGFESQQTISPPQGEGHGGSAGRGRKILVPKSPRSISLGSRPSGTVNAQQSPFFPSRGHVYTAEPGPGQSSEVPPMPLPPGQSPYNIPQHSTPSDPRRTTSATMAAPLRTPLSQSASPSTSVRSSFSGAGQTSPAVRFIQGQQQSQSGSYFPGSSFVSGPGQGESFQAAQSGTEGPYMTPLPESLYMGRPQSGGQNPNIRMMSITTEHGPMFVPVDVQAASKVADEKRARNAGASARFRARRKEKEKEANNTIGSMQKDLKDRENALKQMETERDFYRTERDRFRDILYRNPATRDLAMQAPQSPRLTRTPAYPPPPSGSMYAADSELHQESGRPSQRRRVNPSGEFTYGGPPVSNFPPPSFPPAPLPGQGYGPGPGQPPTSLPPLRMENVTTTGGGVQTPSSQLPPTTRPSPFEQYPRDRYERGWPGGPEERKPPSRQ